jgi:hypothetical protein
VAQNPTIPMGIAGSPQDLRNQHMLC